MKKLFFISVRIKKKNLGHGFVESRRLDYQLNSCKCWKTRVKVHFHTQNSLKSNPKSGYGCLATKLPSNNN